MIKSKNFTMARIRRLVLCAFLGITGNELKNPPAYARILGMNSKGREILINRQQWLEMQAYSSSQPFTAENTEQMSFDNEDTLDDGIVSENYDDLD